MTSLRQAAQQALEALSCLEYDFCGITDGPSDDTTEAAITALRAALAEPVQERKPLMEGEIKRIDDSTHFHESPDWSLRFARAIEQAHGIMP